MPSQAAAERIQLVTRDRRIHQRRCGYKYRMCSHYQMIKEREQFKRAFGYYPPLPEYITEIWPGYKAPFLRRPREADAGDEAVPEREVCMGQFGLLPHWAKDEKFGRRTFNARSETAATLPSFRDAWRQGKRCIIPTEAFFEPDWRSGKAIATRISRADGEPMGIAGLWSWWKPPIGDELLSFTMLTINADKHELMRNYHKPTDEKRMVVILPEGSHADWLTAPTERIVDFLLPYPAANLVADQQPSAKRDVGNA